MRSIGKGLREALIVVVVMTGFALVYGLVDRIEQGDAWITSE